MRRVIYSAFCGGNGFLSLGNPGLDAYIQTYLDLLRVQKAKGNVTIGWTLPPRTTPLFNPFRNYFNVVVKAAKGEAYDYLCDLGNDPFLGIDDNFCTDLSKYNADGTHPLQSSHNYIYSNLFMPLVNQARR